MVDTIHVQGDGNTVVVVCDADPAQALRAQREEARRRQREVARRQADERAWARAHPYLYSERGSAAYEDADSRRTLVLAAWTAVPVLVAVVWTFVSVGLPGGFLANLLVLAIGSVLVGAIAAIPAMVVVAVPAMVHVAVLDGRDEKAARLRAQPRERAERLARETAENDRRLAALGVDL